MTYDMYMIWLCVGFLFAGKTPWNLTEKKEYEEYLEVVGWLGHLIAGVELWVMKLCFKGNVCVKSWKIKGHHGPFNPKFRHSLLPLMPLVCRLVLLQTLTLPGTKVVKKSDFQHWSLYTQWVRTVGSNCTAVVHQQKRRSHRFERGYGFQ